MRKHKPLRPSNNSLSSGEYGTPSVLHLIVVMFTYRSVGSRFAITLRFLAALTLRMTAIDLLAANSRC